MSLFARRVGRGANIKKGKAAFPNLNADTFSS